MAERPPPPEFIVIFLDNGRRASCCRGFYHAQLEATKLYCKTLLQCNPKSIVNIFTMSSLRFGTLVRPTSDLEKVMSKLQYVPYDCEGETEFQRALARALGVFSEAPSDMKKRLLMFVGSTISLHLSAAASYGKMLKECGVALDVFNFFRLEIDVSFNKNASVLEGYYHYGRTELETLVTEVNDHDNSHIIDITDEYESSVLDILRKSILKDQLHYLEKKAAADDEKNKSAETRELERFNEKKKSAADEKNKSVETRELEQFNEKKKSAADDEYGQCFSGKKKIKQKKKKTKQKKKKN